MAYKFPSILTNTRINIDEDGNTLLTAASAVYGTLGAYIQISVGITASGLGVDGNSETVYDRLFSFRWKYYTQQNGGVPQLSSSGFRLKTGTVPAAAAPMEFFSANGITAETNENHTATLEVVSETQVLLVFRFYLTSEDPAFVPYYTQNLNRLLASRNQGNYMELEAGSQFAVGATGISIVGTVSGMPETVPPSPAYIPITRGFTGSSLEYWTPINMKWPGRNSINTEYHLPLEEFEVTNFNGDVFAAKTHKSLTDPHASKYDDNFVVTASQLSSFEDNFFRFKFALGSLVSFTATAVRVFLLRTDQITNEQNFLLDYQASIAKIPASDTTQDNISGAIYAPAEFTSVSGAEVKFRVPGSELEFGGTYRVLVVLYGSTFSEIYSGVSHELTADHHPNFFPKADLFLADYFKEVAQPKAIAAYHSAFRSRIEILKSSVLDAFAYYGLTGDFDTSVQYVRADYVKPGTENTVTFTPASGNPPFLWIRGGGLIAGNDYTNTAEYLMGSFTDYLDEELLPMAGELESDYYVSILWEIGIESTLPNGVVYLLKCQYKQYLVARRWEDEAGQPTQPPFTLSMTLYRSDGVTEIQPGSKYVCGSTSVKALVEKSDVLSGGGLDAYVIPGTYAQTDSAGNTTAANIKQRRGAFLGFIGASSNLAINAYDAMFSNNGVIGSTIDDAGVNVGITELSTLQEHWLEVIARPDNTDESPFIAVDAEIEMIRDGAFITTVTVDFTAWRAAFDALLTGGDTLVDFRIKNAVTQDFTGIVAGGSGNPSSSSDICQVTINHKKTPIKVIDVVYEIEGTINGHLVRFLYRGWITLPTAPGTITEAVTPSLWKIIDFDF